MDSELTDRSDQRDLGRQGETGAGAQSSNAPQTSSVAQVGNAAQISNAHESPFAATLTALRDLLRPRRDIDPPDASQRLDGAHCLVTGASKGLGRAVARDLARRGASLTLVARKPPKTVAEELLTLGAPEVRALGCDLSDLGAVAELATALSTGPSLSRVILNAGLMPRETRLTPQGYEEMFAVHFAANVVLFERLVAARKLVGRAGEPARVIVVSSESYRSSPPVDADAFEQPPRFGMSDGMKWYGHSKLLLLGYLSEWVRQHPLDASLGSEQVAVHMLCPGPIASNIARESPAWVRPVLGPVMRLLFNAPAVAATPVLYFACSPDVAWTTGDYLHMRASKELDPRVTDPAFGEGVQRRARQLFTEYLSK